MLVKPHLSIHAWLQNSVVERVVRSTMKLLYDHKQMAVISDYCGG